MYTDGKLSLETAQALALQLGIVPPSIQAAVVESLVKVVHERNDHLDTGKPGCCQSVVEV